MRAVHFGLIGLIVVVFCIAYFERRPALEDYDPVKYPYIGKEEWDQRTHIAYWEKWSSFEAEACQQMCDEYNQDDSPGGGKADGIFVHYIRKSQVDRAALLACLGHTPPDVVGLWAYNVVQFGGHNALQPLDDRMKSADIKYDDYIKGYLDQCQFQGKTWVLPSAVASLALFWNKEHFQKKAPELRKALEEYRKKIGDKTPIPQSGEIPPPETIGELDAYADVLNEFNPDGSPKIMGMLHTEPGWWNYNWGYHFGGELIDKQTGKIIANDEGNIEAYTWIKRYAEAYGRDKLLRFKSGFGTFDSPQNAFIEGKVSMQMQGVWFPNFIRRHRPQMEFGVAPFPCVTREMGPRGMMDVDVLGIPKDCKHPEEAWKFILWVQKKGMSTLCKMQGKSIGLKEIPKGFLDNHPNPEVGVFINLDRSKNPISIPTSLVGQELRDEMNRVFEETWNWRVDVVKANELEGLTGEARKKKIDELCREFVKNRLDEAHKKIQGQLDAKLAAQLKRQGGE
jgi:multiple sugar transport system substrate-binding protein